MKEYPRAWLRPHRQMQQAASSEGQQVTSSPATSRSPKHVTHDLTATMAKAGEFQCMLTAVPHPHAKTGYKDPRDPCNRTDKRNGGQYRRFESSYSKHFASIDDKPIQFREDGLPISARMVPGKPLMAPKLPNAADMSIAKRLFKKYNHSSSVCIGLPGNKDPQQFKSVYAIVHNAPHRQLAQPNSGIAAEDAARAHHSLGLYN
ncbi:hypothetical protein OEZ85_013007 [Tetradesmus obliquus]|uniref:Uncharacterized protein n=1 Tax=Tetradesmus obliquus TaxID=3088 RepID=A0ABY8U8E3_TETOB|nr:hypothetical protein OEZ85_013007 [Tetradesmus obliquus]